MSFPRKRESIQNDIMEISEIKQKILKKIEGGGSKASKNKKKRLSLAALSEKMGKSEEELRKLFDSAATEVETAVLEESVPEEKQPDYQDRLRELEAQNSLLQKVREDSRSKSDDLLNRIEEKDRAISELQRKLDSESAALIEETDKQKSLINTAIEKSIEEYRVKLSNLENENKSLKATHTTALKENEEIFFKIAGKDKEIDELKKLQEDKLPTLESENKKIKKLHEDALRQNDSLLVTVEEHRAEKEKAVNNMESLRSKLYTSAKELKEQSVRIASLEDVLKHRDKKLADSEKAYKALEKDKNESILKLQASEESARGLKEKTKELEKSLEEKDRRVTEAEKIANKNIETARKDMDLQIQAVERNRKTLESKIAQLNIEVDAKNKRIEEAEGSNRELDSLVKESASKLQEAESANSDLEEKIAHIEAGLNEAAKLRENDRLASEENIAALKNELETLKAVIKDKEKAEEELRENILRFESEIESRDKKIQTDIRYCEGVVREVNDLRQKIKAYRLKVK